MRVFYTSRFLRRYESLTPPIMQKADERIALFCKEPFNHILKTHKLHGRLRGLWAFSVGSNYRIIFEFAEKDRAYFHTIGDHSIYD